MIVGFDTATAATAVAATRDGEEVFSAAEGSGAKGRPRHASLLLPLVERAARECGGWGEVDRVAVGVGPGTFTGIRIGIVTAKALAIAHRCELVGVETTWALAARAARAAGEDACAVIDGKRGEVFACRATPEGEVVWGPLVVAPEELAERLDGERFDGPLVGDGVELYAGTLIGSSTRRRGEDGLDRIDAAEICRLGAVATARPPAQTEPLYLRRPDAERWIKRDA